MPYFTVFTPTYNRGYTLYRLYESLKSQRTIDFEWMIVDDGSTDNTSHLYQYVIEYGQNNPSFVNACRNIYWKYYRQLVHCSIYTWKEKALYSLFMMGFKTYEEK